MRSLHADLLAAQKARTGHRPVVSLTLRDRTAGIPRPHPELVHDDATSSRVHDATVTSLTGKLIRARDEVTNGDPEINIEDDHDNSPDYSTFTVPFATNVLSQIAIRANHDPDSQRVVLTNYNTGNTRLRRAVSNDEGATWAGINVVNPLATCSGCAGVPRNDTDELIIWTTGSTLNAVRIVAGVVGTVRTSGIAFSSASGVSADRIGDDILVVFSALLSDGRQVVYATFFDWSTDAWGAAGAVRTIAEADVAVSIDYLAPFVDTAGGFAVTTFVERYTGTGGITSRTMISYLAIGAPASSERWSQPRPIVDSADTLGVAVAFDPVRGGYFFSRADAVWRSAPVADLVIPQTKIISLSLELEPFDGTLIVRIDDDDRLYAPAVEDIDHPLSPGAQVDLSLGYKTTSGDRTSAYPGFWIETIDLLVEGQRRHVIITARDVHSLLASWRPRDATEYRASRSTFQVVDLLTARAGIDYATTSQSGNLTALLPDWFHDVAFMRWLTTRRPPGWQKAFYRDPATPSKGNPPPGVSRGTGIRWDVLERLLSPPVVLNLEASQDGLIALQRVLSTVRDVSYGQDERLLTKDLDPAEASVYDYGDAGEHPIRRARYRRRAAAVNHAYVWGGVASDRVRSVPDWTEIRDAGRESVVTITDIAADTDAKADARAEATLRPAHVERRQDLLEIFPNVGQELWDVITISESIAGQLVNKVRRVTALRAVYDTGTSPDFVMWLTLGER